MHTDIQIAGIKANYPAYSVAWQINQAFDMQFHMSLDWEIENKVGEVNKHIHFFEQFEDVELNWHLIQNRSEKSFIFNSKPLFDYFLICHGEDIYKYFERAVASVENTSIISHIFSFPFSIVKPQNSIYNNLINTKNFISEYNV